MKPWTQPSRLSLSRQHSSIRENDKIRGIKRFAKVSNKILAQNSSNSTSSGMVVVHTESSSLVKIDCSGEMFVTTERTLANYPATLLGDAKRRAKYYNSELGKHFFDRNQDIFSAILYFYQSPGTFRPPESIDPIIVDEELDFFDIDLQHMTETYDEIEKRLIVPAPLTKMAMLHETITDPSYNKLSFIWAAIDMVCILITITMLIVESMPQFKEYFEKPFQSYDKILIYSMDVMVNTFFTVDLVFRFITWPDKRRFLRYALNITDILAVTPFYVELAVLATTTSAPAPQFLALKVCRIVRVVRVLKIVRHSKQLTEVMEVVSSAKEEFGVLIGIVSLAVVLVGTVMYFLETHANNGYDSILDGCWWTIVTITTVGYGDLSPGTVPGKLFGSMVALFGIVVLAFPMTIIISKFQDSFNMKKLKANKEMTRKLREMAATGAFASYVYNKSAINGGEEYTRRGEEKEEILREITEKKNGTKIRDELSSV